MLAVFYACMCLYAHLCMPGVNVVLSLLLFSSVGYGQDMGYGQGKCQIIILFDWNSSLEYLFTRDIFQRHVQ
jgi:hypothetical protein